MSESEERDINKIVLKGLKLGVLRAIDVAARTNTCLISEIDGKIIAIKPPYKYVKVPQKSTEKILCRSPKKKKSK